MIKLNVNGKTSEVDVDPKMPLLWAIRDHLNLTGTKFGCGRAQCGACTVQMDGMAVRSCSIMAGDAEGRAITTIEAVEGSGDKVAKAVQTAWQKLDVVQCGYCQSGQIMAAIALLNMNPKPTDADIDNSMIGNLCRCGTYVRVRAAIHEAARAIA